MKKHILSTISLLFLLFWPVHAQQLAPEAAASESVRRAATPVRLETTSESEYLTELARKGFNLEAQGFRIESLDGRTVYADLNSGVGFNPASVIKVATSFAALTKFGPDYQFETSFYQDGAINKKTRTLNGNLILIAAGDPVLNSLELSRLIRAVVHAGIARVNGKVIVSGPFTYAGYITTERALKGLSATLRRAGLRVSSVVAGPSKPGATKIATHFSTSLRDILFYQNAHSVNQTAERLGEALGGPRAVEKFLIHDVGIAPDDVAITHTSGLDFNRITPRATVMLFRELVFWLNLKNMQPQDILPVAGVDAGTLKRRFTGVSYRGAIVGKTGTLPATDGGVSTLAGVIYTRDNGPVLFAIFNTKGPVATSRRLQDEYLKEFISESGGIPDGNVALHRANN